MMQHDGCEGVGAASDSSAGIMANTERHARGPMAWDGERATKPHAYVLE